ncbi:MAG: hypothetical protein V4805_04870 [Pseudomonadota bacterium]
MFEKSMVYDAVPAYFLILEVRAPADWLLVKQGAGNLGRALIMIAQIPTLWRDGLAVFAWNNALLNLSNFLLSFLKRKNP